VGRRDDRAAAAGGEQGTFVRFQSLVETPSVGLSGLLSLAAANGFELLLGGEPFVAALYWSVCCTT
jgi:hypothetical protein